MHIEIRNKGVESNRMQTQIKGNMSIFISENVDFWTRNISEDKDEHFNDYTKVNTARGCNNSECKHT